MIAEARKRGVDAHVIEDRGGFQPAIVDAICSLVDDLDIDILHASDFRTGVYCLLAGRRRPDVVLVRTTHGWIANTPARRIVRFLDKVTLRWFDHVTTVSAAMRRLVPRWWLPDQRVTLVHNALALDTYGKDGWHTARAAPDPTKEVVVLNVGRLSPEKGQDLLVRAVAHLAQEFPGLRLRIAGIGPMEAELRALAEQLGISRQVEFLLYVDDMPRAYVEADVVVQSSLTEGLPNVILEAAFVGTPVVATDVGGTREVIEHGSSGWLIRPGSVDDIVRGLRRYLTGPADFLDMCSLARARVEQMFSFDARVEKMTRLYERIACR